MGIEFRRLSLGLLEDFGLGVLERGVIAFFEGVIGFVLRAVIVPNVEFGVFRVDRLVIWFGQCVLFVGRLFEKVVLFGHWGCKRIVLVVVIGVLLVVDFIFVDGFTAHLDSLENVFFEQWVQ